MTYYELFCINLYDFEFLRLDVEKKFIPIKEASKLLSIGVTKINMLIKERKIPSYKVNGKRLFDKDELIKWVKSHKDDRE